MRILVFSSLFPNAQQPSHGIFVENRLRQLRSCAPGLEARVVAPVPWFPLSHPAFGQYAAYARVQPVEQRDGLSVLHPRYPVIPRVGMSIAPLLMYLWSRATVRRLWQDGFHFDLIDAHYLYPDGVAAAWLAREYDRPLVATGRGTDLNLIPRYALPRRQIRWLLRRADHLILVAAALKTYLYDMEVPDGSVTVLRNGVDPAQFAPVAEREGLRAQLGMAGPQLLSVGHLIERKGHHLVIEALAGLPGFHLTIAGDGPEKTALQGLCRRLGVTDRVRFTGRLATPELVRYYAASDALVLASSREGWANVLLEAMACGTPVVATPADGNPEVVAAPAAGLVTQGRDVPAIIEAVQALFSVLPDRAATRAYAERFGWHETSHGQLAIFERVVAEHAARAGAR